MMRNTEKKMNEAAALRRLESLCARSEHSEGELRDKMRGWGLPDEAQDRMMATLIKTRYVDDRRFAEAFVHDKIVFNGWGRRKIEQALWAKHVDEAVYTPVLDAVDDALYLKALRPLVRQKYRSVKADSEYERVVKVTKYATGRGFDFEQVRHCLDEMVKEMGENGAVTDEQ